jgi:hypothetical protein
VVVEGKIEPSDVPLFLKEDKLVPQMIKLVNIESWPIKIIISKAILIFNLSA